MNIKSTLTALIFTMAFASPILAQEVGPATVPTAPKLGEVKNDESFWGFGLGYMFTSIPISASKLQVIMGELHYGYYLTDPNASLRTAATVGLYGFDLILPFPKASLEMLVGSPDQNLQGKLGVGGFYDITIGGAAGVSCELGVRIKNRIDVSFFAVPAGTQSKRDYRKFVGDKPESEPNSNPTVVYPFYGLFMTFNY